MSSRTTTNGGSWSVHPLTSAELARARAGDGDDDEDDDDVGALSPRRARTALQAGQTTVAVAPPRGMFLNPEARLARMIARAENPDVKFVTIVAGLVGRKPAMLLAKPDAGDVVRAWCKTNARAARTALASLNDTWPEYSPIANDLFDIVDVLAEEATVKPRTEAPLERTVRLHPTVAAFVQTLTGFGISTAERLRPVVGAARNIVEVLRTTLPEKLLPSEAVSLEAAVRDLLNYVVAPPVTTAAVLDELKVARPGVSQALIRDIITAVPVRAKTEYEFGAQVSMPSDYWRKLGLLREGVRNAEDVMRRSVSLAGGDEESIWRFLEGTQAPPDELEGFAATLDRNTPLTLHPDIFAASEAALQRVKRECRSLGSRVTKERLTNGDPDVVTLFAQLTAAIMNESSASTRYVQSYTMQANQTNQRSVLKEFAGRLRSRPDETLYLE